MEQNPNPMTEILNRFGKVTVRLVVIMVGMVVVRAESAELYKYIDENGVTVLESTVPARYLKRGYTILSLDGRVLEVIPRALTAQETAEKEMRLAEIKRLDQEEDARIAADLTLLRLYSTPEDVERAMDTKVHSIEGFIDTQKGNLERLKVMKREMEAKLADVERAGGEIRKEPLERIRTLEVRIERIDVEIAGKYEEIDEIRISFGEDLERVRALVVGGG